MLKFKSMIEVNACNGKLRLGKRALSLLCAGATVVSLSGCSIKEEDDLPERGIVYVNAVSESLENDSEVEKIDGVMLEMFDSNGRLVDQWTSSDIYERGIVDLGDGDYIITVKSVPEGYLFPNDYEVEVTIGEEKIVDVEISIEHDMEYVREQQEKERILKLIKNLGKED